MKEQLTYKKISEIGIKEKYIRKNHYNGIKVWWARRPITTMRSLLIREVLEINNLPHNVDAELFSEINPSNIKFDNFANQFHTDIYSVLDLFAGGGAIPFESARLGFKTYSSELNPIASLLQKTIFNSQNIIDYDIKLEKSGLDVIQRAQTRLERYFKIGNITPYVIFWEKIAKCKNCDNKLSLRRIEYLSKRKNKPVRVVEANNSLHLENTFSARKETKKSFICNKCGTKNTFNDIKKYCKKNKLIYKPFVICFITDHKNYKLLSDSDLKAFDEKKISEEIKKLKHLIPNDLVKSKGGVINPTLYDLKTPKDFFSRRQLLVLLTIIDEIIIEYKLLKTRCDLNESIQIILGLTSLIEFLVDWNGVSTMWISQNEQTGRSLAGPGVGMKWDFIEVNPFSNKGSNLRSKIRRVAKVFKAIKFNNQIRILEGTSANLDLPSESIDIILTDPPYYDSIDYTALSEFFRPWFEILIKKTFDDKISLKNKDNFEAIVDLANGEKKKDHYHYKNIMTDVLSEANRVLKDNGTLMLLFSHKTVEGWGAIADSFKDANFFIKECIPLEMERIARPRAMAYDALNGVVVFKLSKKNRDISSVKSDIKEIRNKIKKGDMSESQIPIYLAGLACKLTTNSNDKFEDSYAKILKSYKITKIDNLNSTDIDLLTSTYLKSRLSIDFLKIEEKITLKKNNLICDGKVKEVGDIIATNEFKETILAKAVSLYNEFKHNSKTKIKIEDKTIAPLSLFFSTINCLQLNTIKKRSSNGEKKVVRLILAKI